MAIIITENKDTTTNKVMDWCLANKTDVQRINSNMLTKVSFELSNETNSLQLDQDDISADEKIWNRRGKINTLPKKELLETPFYQYLKKEEDSFVKSLELHLKSHNSYTGSYLQEVENYKITHLLHAKKVGLKIPKTFITNSKKQLIEFYQKYKPIISKDLRYSVNVSDGNSHYSSIGTFEVTKVMLDNLGDYFAPCFAQERIDKKVEIRVFIFKKKLFPMAIFSQKNAKTSVDYRNYDNEKPNRVSPFQLPKKIEKQLLYFMNLSNLDTGSIDLILNHRNEFVFLEVNPQGQIDWLSKNCNYYIEKYIAKELADEK
ncbi:hypothetical protein [Kordia sp.]|uniref:hypothetical protein n=1 Tax=Kordia sp. TaxID=1965332 RepID=UPI003D2E42EB